MLRNDYSNNQLSIPPQTEYSYSNRKPEMPKVKAIVMITFLSICVTYFTLIMFKSEGSRFLGSKKYFRPWETGTIVLLALQPTIIDQQSGLSRRLSTWS
jgi:hypothetical protein